MSSQFLKASVNFEDSVKDDSTKKNKPYKIFFRDLFLYKENELEAKKKEKLMNRSMKVHQKTTFSSRMKSRSHLSKIAFQPDTEGVSLENLGLDPMLILKLTEKLPLISNKTDSSLASSEKTLPSDDSTRKRIPGKPRKKPTLNPDAGKSPSSNRPGSVSSEDSLEFFLDEDIDYELLPEIYFKEPEELLQVLTNLEEQNLTLVQYSQDVDENLEEVNKREKIIQDKINSNIESLLEHKEILKANCLREEEKAAELELRSRLFSFGQFNSDAQEKLIDSLSKKINQVYKVCIGDAEVGSLNPVQKLVKVESRMVELSDLIDSIPKENVEAIERMKQKDRRQKLREEKLKEKQRCQEERLKAALERAVARPKKKVGRRLIYRSKPPSANRQKIPQITDTAAKSQEEEVFFFS